MFLCRMLQEVENTHESLDCPTNMIITYITYQIARSSHRMPHLWPGAWQRQSAGPLPCVRNLPWGCPHSVQSQTANQSIQNMNPGRLQQFMPTMATWSFRRWTPLQEGKAVAYPQQIIEVHELQHEAAAVHWQLQFINSSVQAGG